MIEFIDHRQSAFTALRAIADDFEPVLSMALEMKTKVIILADQGFRLDQRRRPMFFWLEVARKVLGEKA